MALQQLQVRPVITGATSTQIGKSLIASEAFFIDDFKPETLLRFASGQVETVHKKDCPFIPISALAFFG